MIAREPRTLGYYAASHWFQWAVLLVILGGIGIGLLRALEQAREAAERQSVELTVRNMRTGMQLAMGEALMHQREAEIASWVGSNPVRWLSAEPKGYLGKCSQTDGRELNGGEWCFETAQKRLMYRPYRQDHLQAVVEGRQCDRLSWSVTGLPDRAASSGNFGGLRFETDTLCRWSLDEN